MTLSACPESFPDDISDTLRKLGRRWAKNDFCPHIAPEIEHGWTRLLHEWANDLTLPLLVRKSSLVRGSEVIHATGRKLIPCDNSPAQWTCSLAIGGEILNLAEIRARFAADAIPVAFANKTSEKSRRRHHCTLKKFSVNKPGWKLCHIESVGLTSRLTLDRIDISELKLAFIGLLNPANYFLVPKRWGGLGEVPEFIDGFQKQGI